jgi:hypothetical protein
LHPGDAEILRLVAANTPSHRGAWKKDSRAWQLFVRRNWDKGPQSGGQILEESEDDAFGKYTSDEFDEDDGFDDRRGNTVFHIMLQPQSSQVFLIARF